MDPNETLRRIREEVAALDMLSSATTPEGVEAAASHAFDLAEYVRALDEWLSRGGFPPEEWREGPDAPDERVPEFHCPSCDWTGDDGYCPRHRCRTSHALPDEYDDSDDDGDNYTGPTFRETED